MDGVDLVFDDDAVKAIAKKAYDTKTGARGLRSIMEKLMMGYMYSIPSDPSVKKLVIDKEKVANI